MACKYFEVRDRATYVPVVAVRLDDNHITRRAGHASLGSDAAVLVTSLLSYQTYSSYGWDEGRTMRIAARHIGEFWDSLNDFDVIDVEFILGETSIKKVSEHAPKNEIL